MPLTRTLITRGFGGLSTPAGPTAPTLAIADNGNGTATATISGGDSGSANVVYYKSADGNLTTSSWTSGGSRTGNGTVTLSLGAGLYWGYNEATLNSQEVATVPVFFAITVATDSLHKRCLDAVVSRIQSLSLAGVAGASVLVRKVASDEGIGSQQATPEIAFPSIIVAQGGTEQAVGTAGTNNRDQYGYPCIVGMVDTDSSLTTNHSRNLLWRERIMRAFQNQRLPGVTEVNWCIVEPGDITKFADFKEGKYVSFLTVRCIARVTRGV
jgi:hypothetical protein